MAAPAIGAALAGGTLVGGMLMEGADDINVQYPEPGPVEKQIAHLQLETARDLSAKVNDPKMREMIYKNLPEVKMSQADRMAYTKEVGDIKKQMASASMDMAGRAYGMSLDDAVSKGRMSQEQANSHRIKNEAALNATLKIYNKKLDASRISMARNKFFKEQNTKMRTGGLFQDIDSMNKRTLSTVMSNALGAQQQDRARKLNLKQSVQSANWQNELLTKGTRADLLLGMGEAFADTDAAKKMGNKVYKSMLG